MRTGKSLGDVVEKRKRKQKGERAKKQKHYVTDVNVRLAQEDLDALRDIRQEYGSLEDSAAVRVSIRQTKKQLDEMRSGKTHSVQLLIQIYDSNQAALEKAGIHSPVELLSRVVSEVVKISDPVTQTGVA